MNNQAISTAARIAPPLALVLLAGVVIKALLFGEKSEQKPETTPVAVLPPPLTIPLLLPPVVAPPTPPKPPESAPVSTVPLLEDLPESLMPKKRRLVLREDLAAIFNNGKRPLYRVEAVVELQRRGFGQTAAYKALSPDGRFASWMHIAPDGVITWNG